jgi:hypothetical protein
MAEIRLFIMTLPGCSPLCSRSQNPDLNRTVPDNVPITIILPDEMLSVDWAEADIIYLLSRHIWRVLIEGQKNSASPDFFICF